MEIRQSLLRSSLGTSREFHHPQSPAAEGSSQSCSHRHFRKIEALPCSLVGPAQTTVGEDPEQGEHQSKPQGEGPQLGRGPIHWSKRRRARRGPAFVPDVAQRFDRDREGNQREDPEGEPVSALPRSLICGPSGAVRKIPTRSNKKEQRIMTRWPRQAPSCPSTPFHCETSKEQETQPPHRYTNPRR